MSNQCIFCEQKVETNHLILSDGSWLEFCGTCGDTEVLHNNDGETATIRQVFDMCKNK